VLDMLAAQKIPLIACHFPRPGYGHVAKHGDGLRYYPAPMHMVMDMKCRRLRYSSGKAVHLP